MTSGAARRVRSRRRGMLSRNHADGSGWNGQLAAEFQHRKRAHQRVRSRPTQSGGRVARHNRPVACSTQNATASFRLSFSRNHAIGSGWHGQLGRSRRQLAAEFRHRPRTHPKLRSRRPQSDGRTARHNVPSAHTTQTSTASFRLGAGTPLQADPVGQASSPSVLGFQPVAPPVWRGAGSPGTDRPVALSYFPDRLCAGTMQMDPGGTANLAVLDGNVPPSFGTGSAPTKECILGAPRAAGASPATTGRWPVPPRPLLHRSG